MTQALASSASLRPVETTPDSEPGWTPREDWLQQEAARQAASSLQISDRALPDLGSDRARTNRRAFQMGIIASLVWVAAVTATMILLVHFRLLAKLDATNLLALAGSVFAPLSFIWMVVIAALRAGPLDEERARVASAIHDLIRPFEATRDQALQLREQLGSEIERLQTSADALDARVQMLAPPLEAQISRLNESAQRLETAQQLAETSAVNLKAILSDISAMAEQVGTRLPEAASSVSHASTEVALHGEHLENAARTLTQVVSSARDSMAQLLPMLARVTFQTHEASESLSTKLSDLREQAEETGARLDATGDKASSVLDNSRKWVDEQIAAVEASIARIEADSTRRIETLAREVKALDDDSGSRLMGVLEGVQQQIHDSDVRVRDNLNSLKAEWDTLLSSADSISMSIGVRLLDAMARARGVANDAINAARDASQGIIELTESTLAGTQKQALATAESTLEALQQRAHAFATLAAEAHSHARSVREVLETQTGDNIARMAAQIIDGLNNSSIDIARILSADVPESEWREYMAGDRSLFTRKAVRLADRSTEGRIAEFVRQDSDYREVVARFLRGFEQLLKLNMGNGQSDTLSLALLSSDWGKLYVTLSSATERL